jgi:hypothetical protein
MFDMLGEDPAIVMVSINRLHDGLIQWALGDELGTLS